MKSTQFNDNLYGIYFCKDENYEIYDFCFLKDENGSAKIPLGEILFYIIESVEFLSNMIKNVDSLKLDNYFSDKKYNLKRIFLSCKIDSIEIKRLEKIKEFVAECSNNKDMCKIESLSNLVISIFSNHHKFNKYNNKFKITYRKILSNNPLPYFVDDNLIDINKYLSSKYIHYSFYTSTKFDSLSELCIISLYEIFKLNLTINKCKMCNHYYIKRDGNLCNRELIENDFRGCQKYNEYLYNKNYRNNTIIKEYKKIFSRLSSRAECGSIEANQIFNDFKTEWKAIKKIPDKESQRSLQIDFLKQKRWE